MSPRLARSERGRALVRGVVCAVCLAMLAGAASADAATLDSSSQGVSYTAGPGIANNLSVTESGSSLVFSDTAENITDTSAPQFSCSGSGTKTVTCPGTAIAPVSLATGDGVDHVTVARNTPLVAAVPATLLDGGTGNDVLTGGAEMDVFLGTDGDGDDQLTGGGGFNIADYSLKSAGVHVTLGTAGGGNGVAGENDTYAADINSAAGSPAHDVITGGAEANRIEGRGGPDTINSGGGDDRIDAAATGVTIVGAAESSGNDNAPDTVDAGPGADTITVAGGDEVHAGDGPDSVRVTADAGSAERIFGDGGDDTIVPGDGNDVADGGDGNDTILGETTVGAGLTDDDTFSGGAGDDVVRGFNGDDVLDGGGGSDDLEGADGADTITGGSGTDSIDAGTGADTVHAADGERDSVTCGGGADGLDGDAIDAVAADCETIGGGAMPLGSAIGQTGPVVAAGPPGAAGAAAAAAPPPFVLVAVDRRLTGKSGKRVAFRYVSTLAGAATLVVRKGSKPITEIRATTKPGVNTIAWNGKQGKRRARKGSYTLTLAVVSVEGQTKTAKVAVKLR
jgi:Ca2+-binding RTX toxin-like protein